VRGMQRQLDMLRQLHHKETVPALEGRVEPETLALIATKFQEAMGAKGPDLAGAAEMKRMSNETEADFRARLLRAVKIKTIISGDDEFFNRPPSSF